MYGKIRISVLNNEKKVYLFTGRMILSENSFTAYDPAKMWDSNDSNKLDYILSNVEVTNIAPINYFSFRCIGYTSGRWDALDVSIHIQEEPKQF